MAMAWAGLGRPERALVLAAAVEALWESLGTSPSVRFWDELLDRYVGAARRELGASARRTGRRAARWSSMTPSSSHSAPTGLTRPIQPTRIAFDGPSRHARRGRIQVRAAHLARGAPSGRPPRPPRRSDSLRRARDARVEPRALRRGLRRAHVARGVRRRRRAIHAPGDLPRGDGPSRSAAAHRRDRHRHGRADDHRARHGGAESALPRAAPLGGGDLVPGLLRARRRVRSRRRADELDPRRRALRRERPEGVVVLRAPRRLLHPPHAYRPRLDAGTRASRT